jgi:hypothetical protein
MKKTITRSSILMMLSLSILFVSQVSSYAQKDSTTLWNIITNDGNQYTGTIVLQNEKELKLKTTTIGTITLLLANIKKMEEVQLENIRGNEVWMENPQEGRYFFSPSSYGLKKGEGYYQNTWVFFNQVSYGVTDNFSMGLGMVPLFLFSGTSTPVWITPKISIPLNNDNFAIGGGALIGTVVGEGGSYGVAYGTTTLGNRDTNFTFGVGYGYIDDEFASSPALSFSSMIRTGKKGYIITENYLVNTGDGTAGLISFGGRRIWGNASLDFGGIVPLGDGVDDLVLIPWLSFVVAFGQ